jgi:hypothetical protein
MISIPLAPSRSPATAKSPLTKLLTKASDARTTSWFVLLLSQDLARQWCDCAESGISGASEQSSERCGGFVTKTG